MNRSREQRIWFALTVGYGGISNLLVPATLAAVAVALVFGAYRLLRSVFEPAPDAHAPPPGERRGIDHEACVS